MVTANDDPPLTEIKDERGNLLYTIKEHLGVGGYGRVHAATDIITNNKVAVKFEPKNKCSYGTPYEWEVYRALEGKTKLNKIHYKCSSGEHYFMVMDRLKPINVKEPPSLKDVAKFASEAIRIFKDLHKAGYVHGDVKLGNFLSKPCSENSTSFCDELFLMDFGLASRWKDNSTDHHVEYNQHPNKFRGTMIYASVNALLGRTVSRRDDLISLLYTLISLLYLRGTIKEEDKVEPFRRDKDKLAYCKDKMKKNLCFLPKEFEEFAKDVTKLKFDEEPYYDKWIGKFESIPDNNSPFDVNTGNVQEKVGEIRWITVVNTRCPMKQRYHFEIQNEKVLQCVFNKGKKENLYISSAVFYNNTWALIMDESKNFTEQELVNEAVFSSDDSKSSIKNGNFYIPTLIREEANGNVDDKADDAKWLVVKSKGTTNTNTNQICQIEDSYLDLYKQIENVWKNGYFVTSLATNGKQWAFVMSRDAEFSAQVIEFDVCFPSEGIHRRWKQGYRVTAMAASAIDNSTEMAVVMSIPKINKAANGLQEIFISDDKRFPRKKLKECWIQKKYVTSICYATVSFGEEEFPRYLSTKE